MNKLFFLSLMFTLLFTACTPSSTYRKFNFKISIDWTINEAAIESTPGTTVNYAIGTGEMDITAIFPEKEGFALDQDSSGRLTNFNYANFQCLIETPESYYETWHPLNLSKLYWSENFLNSGQTGFSVGGFEWQNESELPGLPVTISCGPSEPVTFTDPEALQRLLEAFAPKSNSRSVSGLAFRPDANGLFEIEGQVFGVNDVYIGDINVVVTDLGTVNSAEL